MAWSRWIFAQFAVALLAFAGCAGGTDDMMENAGASGGNAAFGNASGGSGSSTIHGTGGSSSATGSGGHTGTSAGSGGSPSSPVAMNGTGGSAAAGSGGATAHSGSGGGAPGSGSGGMAGSAGMGDDPFALDPDAGIFDPDPNAAPPAAGQCADAVCFDIFDCTLWHADLVGVCDFTDCVDFVCR